MGVMPVPSTVIQLGEEFVYGGGLGGGSRVFSRKHFFLSCKKWKRQRKVPAEKWGVQERGGISLCQISFVVNLCRIQWVLGQDGAHGQRWGRALWDSLQSWRIPVSPSQVHAWKPALSESRSTLCWKQFPAAVWISS